MGRQLGTAGGGNHFVEISTVSKVHAKARARQAGLRSGGLVVLAHSGSRGAGGALAREWAAAQLTSDEPAALATYLADLAGATRFAQANRFILVWRMLTALGAARTSRLGQALDLTHNTVERSEHEGEAVYIHRKGAAPAERDALTVVLGSRGTPSVVMEGLGSKQHLCSVAHGAGRRMGRSEALDKLRARYTKKTVRGGRVVIYDDARLLFEEHPDAYKPVAPVVRSLERAAMAKSVVDLTPLITVKR